MGFFDRITNGVVAWGQDVVSRVAQPLREERERMLAAREALYRGEQYQGRGLAPSWDKAPIGQRRVPLRLQKPSVQYDLPKLSVRRVTSMLFGEGKHPALAFEIAGEAEGEEDNEKAVASWLDEIAERSGLWPAVLLWSRLSLAVGSGCLTWSVVEGDLEFRVLRSQHCIPSFDPKRPRKLVGLELRYKFAKVVREQSRDGAVTERLVDHWHREVWTADAHTVFVDAPVSDKGQEPTWLVADEVQHGLGVVPAVWVRPLDDADEGALDGEPMFEGVEDLVEDIDRVLSQKSRALRYNLDPTRVWFGLSEKDEQNVRTADGPAVSVSAKTDGADVTQLELNGSSLEVAEAHAAAQRARALETTRVVSPDPDKLLAAANSGKALEILYAPMLELCGELRTSFGAALKQLISQILDAVRSGPLGAPGALAVPPPPIPAGKLCLRWGSYFAPTSQDQANATNIAVSAVRERLLDRETATRWLCKSLGISDVEAVVRALEEQRNSAPKPPTPSTQSSAGETKPAESAPPSPASSARQSDVEDANDDPNDPNDE